MADTIVSTEGQPLRVDVTLDEMEKNAKDAEVAAQAAAKKAEDEAKAKAAAVEDPKVLGLREALRLSEESRLRTERALAEGRTAAPPPPTPKEEKELSKEELAELYKEDPLAAIEYMQARAIKTVETNITQRLQPLVHGNASTLKDQMRAKYPDEFAVFGDQIEEFVSKADKSTFSVAGNWEDMIAWMRGKNFDKLVEHKTSKKREKETADAQAAQIAAAGTHVGSTVRTPTPTSGNGAFDDTTKAIIKELAASGILDANDPEADYRKYMSR